MAVDDIACDIFDRQQSARHGNFQSEAASQLAQDAPLEHDGQITLIKKIEGSSDGRLRHLIGNAKYSDEESLQDAIAKNQSVGQLKPRRRKRADTARICAWHAADLSIRPLAGSAPA